MDCNTLSIVQILTVPSCITAIAETLGIKVCVKAEKKAILDCLECDWVAQNVLTDPHSTNLHILPIGKLGMTVSIYTHVTSAWDLYIQLLKSLPI